METVIWLFLPMFVAGGSALLCFYIMQARTEVLIAKERETIVQLRTMLNSQQQMTEDRLRATEEATQRKALDGFLSDFHIEERHYARESKSLFSNRKSMILQERLFFRNIPLSNWVEHEMVVEEGGDFRKLASATSIFNTKALREAEVRDSSKLLQ